MYFISTSSRHICPLFCARSRLRAPRNGHANFPTYFSIFLKLNTQYTIYYLDCVLEYFWYKCVYSCILKGVPVLCLVSLCIFSITPFSVFTSQKSSQILRESRCSPLSNMVRIEKTSYGIHLNIQHKNLPSQFRKFSTEYHNFKIYNNISLLINHGLWNVSSSQTRKTEHKATLHRHWSFFRTFEPFIQLRQVEWIHWHQS